MLIKFLQDVTVQDKTRRHYPKGCIVEMADDACRHFVTRKKAEFSEAVFDDAESSISKKKRKRRK